MTKYYILIDPFTFKPIEFSEFKKEDLIVASSSVTASGGREFGFSPALCIEVEDIDETLLHKTYNPETGTFE